MADPIDPKFAAHMNSIAGALDEIFNGPLKPGEKPKIGFVLLTAEFGKMEGGRVNYISNGDRKSMQTMLREYLARVDGRYVDADKGAVQ